MQGRKTRRWKSINSKTVSDRRGPILVALIGCCAAKRVSSLSMPIMSRSRKQGTLFHRFFERKREREREMERQRQRRDKCRAAKTRRSINSFVIPTAEQLCPPDYEGNLISRELISLHTRARDNTPRFMRRARGPNRVPRTPCCGSTSHFASFFTEIH